jgi:hypothetical protein
MARIAFLCVGGLGCGGRGGVGGGGGNTRRVLFGYKFKARGRLGDRVGRAEGRVWAVWDGWEICVERIWVGYHRHRGHQRRRRTIDEGRHVVCENKGRDVGIERLARGTREMREGITVVWHVEERVEHELRHGCLIFFKRN